jgi:hypothetical protein
MLKRHIRTMTKWGATIQARKKRSGYRALGPVNKKERGRKDSGSRGRSVDCWGNSIALKKSRARRRLREVGEFFAEGGVDGELGFGEEGDKGLTDGLGFGSSCGGCLWLGVAWNGWEGPALREAESRVDG